MKYFTIKHYETVKLFLDRIKYEVGHNNFYAQSISNEYADGNKVIRLISGQNASDIIKLDGSADKMEEIYNLLKLKPIIKTSKKHINNHMDLDNINDRSPKS